MQNIKETIFYVTKSFSYFSITNIEPNNFRQAKHDSPEAIPQMTYLLKSLLILDLYDFNSTNIQIDQIDDQSLIVSLLALKNSPFLQNYSMNFNSSRELILNVGWLLGVSDYFKKLQLYIENLIKNIQAKTVHHDREKKINHSFNQSLDAAEDFMRLAQLCKNSQKQLISLQKRKEALIKKSNKIFQDYEIRNVKAEQMLQLSNENILNEQIELQQKIIEHQDFLINIHKHQELFWAWMESIIDEDKKQIQDDPNCGFIDESIQITKVVNDLNKEKKIRLTVLQEMIEEFNVLVNEFETQWVRVSKLLQSCEDGQERLKFLEGQIPMISQQQKKIYINFENFKNNKTDWKQLREHEFNNVLKQQIKQLFPQQNAEENIELDDKKIHIEDYKKQISEIKTQLKVGIKGIEKELHELMFIPKLN